jgi:hypothetical protein
MVVSPWWSMKPDGLDSAKLAADEGISVATKVLRVIPQVAPHREISTEVWMNHCAGERLEYDWPIEADMRQRPEEGVEVHCA